MHPTLFVPVENQVRELDAKLLFACIAASRGFPVVFGAKQPLYFALPDYAPGIFIAKSMRARSKLMFDIIRGLGHELVAWDEESLVRFDSPEYYTWRFSPDTFNSISHLFAWGKDDAEMFSRYVHNRGVRVIATGNPRSDLLRTDVRSYFKSEIDTLRRAHGNFILVNTNFSFVNSFLEATALIRQPSVFGRRPSRTAFGLSREFADGMAAHQQAIYDHFRVLLPALAERFPERKIVLRPHPSENHDVWRKELARYRNVEVIHEGNVVPWLMSARVLVHNGCTTAVEGTLAGCIAVAYCPVRSATLDYALPNGLSHITDTVSSTLDVVAGVLDGSLGPIAVALRERLFIQHLTASSGALASDRILDEIEALCSAGLGPKRVAWPVVALARIKAAARTSIKRFNMRRRNHWASGRYAAHRFPGVTEQEINGRIERLQHSLGRFTDLRAEACGESLFVIEPAASAEVT